MAAVLLCLLVFCSGVGGGSFEQMGGWERERIYGELEKENKHLLLFIHIFVIERCLASDFLKFSRHFKIFFLPFCLGNLSFLSHVLLYFFTGWLYCFRCLS